MAKRRGNHEGSISERKNGGKNGRFMAQVTMPDGSRKTKYAKTKTEAREKLEELKAEAKHFDQYGLATIYGTLGEFLAAWLDVIKQHRRPNTYRVHRKNIPPARLTPHHIQKLLSARLDDGLSSTTVRGVHTTLHVALEFGVQQGVLDRNVADRVIRPKRRRYEYKTFTAEQVQQLLAETSHHRLAAFFVLAVSTALRPGELLGLRWEDVDFVTGEIHVSRNMQHVDGVTYSEETKTESGVRTIQLTGRALNALVEHKQRQDAEKAILKDQWDLSWGLVFCSQKGKPIIETSLAQHVYHPALERAGLPHIRLYDLRHTAATLLMEAGVHPKVVQEILGHSSIMLTMGTYTHVMPHMHADAIRKLGEILGDSGAERTLPK